MLADWIKAIFFGMVEGLTEWLPVSSTGHLILLSDRLPFAFSQDPVFAAEFREFFDVAIQVGAILAVPVVLRNRVPLPLRGRSAGEKATLRSLWAKIALASLPAAVLGVLGDRLLLRLTGRDLDGWLYNGPVVAIALIVYGVAFLAAERSGMRRPPRVGTTEAISPRTALGVGWFQALSLIPGTSRSGSTILGATLLGVSRSAATEFSFLMAIPVLLGAGAVKAVGFAGYLREDPAAMPAVGWAVLATGCAVSFAVSLAAVRFLTEFVRRHSFRAFGIYRIALGTAVLVWWCMTK